MVENRGVWVWAGAVALISCAAVVGCSKTHRSASEPQFSTAVESPYAGSPGFGGGEPGEEPKPGDSSPTLSREIGEADVVELVGSHLFVLSSHRGLMVVDLAAPSGLAVVERVLVRGSPLEMLLQENHAIVVTQGVVLGIDSSPELGSQILVLEVQDPTKIQPVATLDVPGMILEARRVGDILYTVSRHERETPALLVSSYDLTDPASIQQVDQVELPYSGWNPHLHVTDHSIYVAYDTFDESWIPQTRVRYLEISDPHGSIEVGTELSLSGFVRDRWQLSEHEGVFRLIVHQPDSGQPALHTFEVQSRDVIVPLATLEIDLPRPETLTASRFDCDRAYIVTFEVIDPLFVIDLSDPANPSLEGELEMSGWLDYIEPRCDRLIALGHDLVSGETQLAVSLIDVSNPATPTLLDRQSFGDGWIGAERDDFAKVFRVIEDRLILVPYQVLDQDAVPGSGSKGRVQVLALDLAQDRLALAGTLEHGSMVRRALGYQQDVLATSDRRVSRGQPPASPADPWTLAQVELVEDVRDVEFFDGLELRLLADQGSSRLQVWPADPDAAAMPWADVSLEVALPRRLFVRADGVIALGASPSDLSLQRIQEVDLSDPLQPRPGVTLDVPGVTPSSSLPGIPNFFSLPYGVHREPCALRLGEDLLVLHRPPHFDSRSTGGERHPGDLLIVDLSVPGQPRLASQFSLPGARELGCPQLQGDQLLFSHSVDLPGPARDRSRAEARYYVDRLDLSVPESPQLVSSINTPGQILALEADGRRAYCVDFQWRESGVETSLCSVRLDSGKATLEDRVIIGTDFSVDVQQNGAFAMVLDAPSQQLKTLSLGPTLELETTLTVPFHAYQGGMQRAGESIALFTSHGYAVYQLEGDGGISLRDLVEMNGPLYRFTRKQDQLFLVGGLRGVRRLDVSR